MKFGAMTAPRARDWELPCELEKLGYDSVWISDSHMLWSDCYALLALAAVHTSCVRLGTGVTNAGTRLAPVTANAIATINELSGGRAFLAIGTGFSSFATMGAPPVSLQQFGEYLRIVRGLLKGDAVECDIRGASRTTRFLEPDGGFIKLAPPPPIYIAANGPRALELAGRYGDGCVTSGLKFAGSAAEMVSGRVNAINRGALTNERTLSDDYQLIFSGYVCILRPGETLRSERVIDEVGALVVVDTLHSWWELAKKRDASEFVPPEAFPVWEDYLAHLDSLDVPKDKLHQYVHKGHGTHLVPEERRFVTPELINASGALIGEADAIIARVRELEQAGVTQLSIMPAMESARGTFAEFQELIVARY